MPTDKTTSSVIQYGRKELNKWISRESQQFIFFYKYESKFELIITNPVYTNT